MKGAKRLMPKRWVWDPKENPKIVELIDSNDESVNWCDALDRAKNCSIGITLAVCASLSIVKRVIACSDGLDSFPGDEYAIKVLEAWIDEPTEKNFSLVFSLLYGDEDIDQGAQNISPYTKGALRCAISHPDGCGEITWALESFCEDLVGIGYDPAWIREVGLRGVKARMRPIIYLVQSRNES
ncbi:hypothetical protein [Hahella sp. NBU794]